jgi:hypothetical protein
MVVTPKQRSRLTLIGLVDEIMVTIRMQNPQIARAVTLGIGC